MFGAVLALAATLLVGMVVEVVAMRRLYGRDHLDHVLATFGLILFFDESVRIIWGPAGLSLPLPPWLSQPVHILPGVEYSAYRLAIIVVTAAVAAFLYVLVMRTRIGMLIRAGASNREMVGALGVNIKLLYTLVFGLGAALAGLAGLMQAPILTVQIGMGENIVILAFVITVIGGIGSIRGALVAAIFVGFIDTLGRAFFPDLVAHGAEQGSGGDRRTRTVVDADLSLDGDRAGGEARRPVLGGPEMSGWLTPRNIAIVTLLAALVLLPLYTGLSGNRFLLTLFTRIVILAMAAVSLNLILGYGDMISFGHAVYLGIGGYAVGMLAHEGVYSGFVQWPAALAASALFALVIGALSLRTRGVYFIMITLAFAQMAYYICAGIARYGGDDGLTIYKRSEFGGAGQPVEQGAVLLHLPGAAVGRDLSGLAAGQLALRHGDPGRALQRPADARHRLSDLPLQAGLFRHRRHFMRPVRRAARQSHRLRQSVDHVLDAFGRPHHHGGARRHGLAVRPGVRRGGAAGV